MIDNKIVDESGEWMPERMVTIQPVTEFAIYDFFRADNFHDFFLDNEVAANMEVIDAHKISAQIANNAIRAMINKV